MLPMKKAACEAAQLRREPESQYRLCRSMSRAYARILHPGPRDRAPARRPSPSSSTAAALSLLVVLLAVQTGALPPKHRGSAVALAQTLAEQVIAGKRPEYSR